MASRFRFSPLITAFGVVFVLISLRASYWQYERLQSKLQYIHTLGERVAAPITPITELIHSLHDPNSAEAWGSLTYHRATFSGTFDFEHEMILRNRRYDGFPGVYALTPLKIDGTDFTIIVSRGFIPLVRSTKEVRSQYQKNPRITFTGLLKESVPRKFLAPSDPDTGPGLPWVDGWLRVDIPNIQKQLPYTVLPVFTEIMETPEAKGIEEKVISSEGGREDVFFIADKDKKIKTDKDIPDLQYPVPVYDTVVSPGRHQSYIYEWIFIALLGGIISTILQLRRPHAKT